MQQHPFVLTLSIFVTTISAILWGTAFSGDSDRIDVGGACTTAVIAALLWVTLWAVTMREDADRKRAAADADKSLLIRKLADDGPVARHLKPVLPSTVPLPRRRPYAGAL